MSLRIRVLLLVFLTNLVVFGAGGVYLLMVQLGGQAEAQSRLVNTLSYFVSFSLPNELGEDRLNLAYLSNWEGWRAVEDALLVDSSLHVLEPSGEIRADGMELNPVGVGNRAHDFDRNAVLAACYEAEKTHQPVWDVAGGSVVPILQPWGDNVWWAVWFRTPAPHALEDVVQRLLPWFLLSTLALTLGFFFALHKLVLDPVARLAGGARVIREGDLSVRLEVPDRRDELADLVRLFNEMASTVQGYQEHLGEEVQRITQEARQAEVAAMAQRRLAAMGELAAGIAHEINNPLGGLQNAITTLERDDLDEDKRKRYLGLLESGLARIGETVSRLRRFTPRQSSQAPMDLDEVIRDTCDLLRHRSERLGVELLTRREPGAKSTVRGARNEAGQALLNLIGNALDSLEQAQDQGLMQRGDGRVELALRSTERGVYISVRDNGPGVSSEELERVQDLFYTTKDVGKGTGLGLGLVNKSMAQHAGEVLITSEQGAYFEVQLFFPFEGSGEQ